MRKSLLVALAATSLLSTSVLLNRTAGVEPAVAQTCWSDNCGPKKEIQFTPGQKVTLKLTNKSQQVVYVEDVPRTRQFILSPGQKFERNFGGKSRQNLSIVFWERSNNVALWPQLSRPDENTLEVELRQGGPGRRSIYLLNDGRVAVN